MSDHRARPVLPRAWPLLALALVALGVVTLSFGPRLLARSAAPPDPPAAETAAPALPVLGDDLTPLIAAFNAASDRTRFLAILSPT